MKYLGIVKWFDETKGFGVLLSPDMGEVFLHKSNCHNVTSLKEGNILLFNITTRSGKRTAIEVHLPSSYEDFCTIFSYLKRSNIVEVTGDQIVWVTNRRKKRETFVSKINVFYKAISQFFKKMSYEEIINYYKKYFDENYYSTDKEDFIEFLISFRSTCFTLKLHGHRHESIEHVLYFLNNIDKKLLFAVWNNKLDEYPESSLMTFINSDLEKKEIFEYPENIFIENYNSINWNDLERLFKQPNGEQIIARILIKKIEAIHPIELNLFRIFSLLDRFKNHENTSIIKSELCKKMLNYFADRDLEEPNYLNEFNGIINEFKNHFYPEEISNFINKFNKNISDESVLNLWRRIKYFEPDADFFQKNFSRLGYREFIAGPEKLQQFYIATRLNELGTIYDAKTFAMLILLILEVPMKLGKDVIEDLPFIYKVILWLTFQKSGYNLKYYQSDSDSLDFNINEDQIIDFLNKLNSIDELGYLLALVLNIQKEYQNSISFYNNNVFFKKNHSERTEIIQKIFQKNGFNKVSFINILYSKISKNNIVRLTKMLIPRFIQTDEILSNDFIISEIFLHITDHDIKREFYEYISSIASNTNKVRLFLDGHIDKVEISNVIEVFNSIAVDEQPILLRRMFFLLHSNLTSSVDVFFEKLISLLTESNINLNVKICLKVLESLKDKDSYVGDNILSNIVFEYVTEDSQIIIQIDDLFEKCKGRSWMTSGEHQKNWYLNIKGKNFPVKDDKIEIGNVSYKLDRESKTIQIDGRSIPFRWHKEETDLFLKKYEIPNGIIFCDAQKSEFDSNFKKQFYWCNNSKCFAPCQNIHLDFEWRDYTLRDFINIMGIPFDNNKYYRFISLVNRANRLLKKLQCSSCNRLLRDSRTSEFAFYRVTTFHCTNPQCEEFHKVIYLNHCLNWKCLNIVDSRISEKCPNGWYICNACDNCCSQEKIERRYSNLLTNNAFNSNNLRHQKLKYQVDNKLGHLEKSEIYNYKTGLLKIYSKDNENLYDEELPF